MRARKRALADSGDVVTVSVDDTKLIWVRHSRAGFRVAGIDNAVLAVTKRATLRVPARVRLEMDVPRWVEILLIGARPTLVEAVDRCDTARQALAGGASLLRSAGCR